MHFAQPEFTPEEVNRAGKYLANAANVGPSLDQSGVDQDRVAAIINNWRAAHMYPAHLFFISLRTKAKKVDSTAFAVQRNKRLQSIRAKLIREPNMKLSQMQDIAGCRAVVKHIRHIEQLREALQASWSKHEAIAFKDYIAHPKSDGYRCLHLKYRFVLRGRNKPSMA